jgi:hypothetical protein
MTADEKAACALYKAITQELYRISPKMIELDKQYEFWAKNEASNIFELEINYLKSKFRNMNFPHRL